MPKWTTRKGDRLLIKQAGVFVHISTPRKGTIVELVRAKEKNK